MTRIDDSFRLIDLSSQGEQGVYITQSRNASEAITRRISSSIIERPHLDPSKPPRTRQRCSEGRFTRTGGAAARW
jgi:hypothetical protein